MAEAEQRIVRGCLIGLTVALLLVGVVSGTVLRHVVQSVPILIGLAVLARRPDWGAYTAIPIFAFWALIVTLIWLFLLGLSPIASGRYTATEVILTFVMIGCSIVGITKSVRLGRSLPPLAKVLTFFAFAGVQFGAMWLSFLRPIANR